MTPAFATGILAMGALAQYAFHMRRIWAAVYRASLVANLYFLFVALCGQSFAKITVLHVLGAKAARRLPASAGV